MRPAGHARPSSLPPSSPARRSATRDQDRGELIHASLLGGDALELDDWQKAQKLRGAALAMWMLFSSPRIPYRSLFGASEDGLTSVDVPLTEEHCRALGVRNAQPAGRRRTVNQAGERICAADRSFVAFEAHGGRGQHDFLRVVRRGTSEDALERPYATHQLELAAR